MALVMLPCDLPWWPSIQRHLTQAAKAADADELIDSMQKIHNMCKYVIQYLEHSDLFYCIFFLQNIIVTYAQDFIW